MIGWLEGQVGDAWQDGNRHGLLLICSGVGYEVQVADALRSTPCGTKLAVHVHHQQRDDGSVLFGFAQKTERDLFRLLISVNGVGPQMAMGLLSSLGMDQLLQAVGSHTVLVDQRLPFTQHGAEPSALLRGFAAIGANATQQPPLGGGAMRRLLKAWPRDRSHQQVSLTWSLQLLLVRR